MNALWLLLLCCQDPAPRVEAEPPRALDVVLLKNGDRLEGRIVAQGRVDDLLNGQKPSVRLTVPDTGAAVRAFESLPGVENVQASGDTLIVMGVTSQMVMNHLLQNHIIPTEITAQKNDLESLFMDVTSAN